jgi:hypothetical protein
MINFVESMIWFASLTGLTVIFFLLIELDYMIVYFSFYYIVKKNSFEKKNMSLNFRKSMNLLMGLTNLTSSSFLICFFWFHSSILDWLKIKFHNLFRFTFYEVIIVLKKTLCIDLTLDFAIVYFCYHIVT